jgi:hypothetical protein
MECWEKRRGHGKYKQSETEEQPRKHEGTPVEWSRIQREFNGAGEDTKENTKEEGGVFS